MHEHNDINQVLWWPMSMQGTVSKDPEHPTPIPSFLTQPIPIDAPASLLQEIEKALRQYLRTVHEDLGFFNREVFKLNEQALLLALKLVPNGDPNSFALSLRERQETQYVLSVVYRRKEIYAKWKAVNEERARWCRERLATLNPALNIEDAPLPSRLLDSP